MYLFHQLRRQSGDMDGYYPEAGVCIMALVSEPPKLLHVVPIIRTRRVVAARIMTIFHLARRNVGLCDESRKPVDHVWKPANLEPNLELSDPHRRPIRAVGWFGSVKVVSILHLACTQCPKQN
jgi:hypothetical protein